jgi:hypothetical protein
MPEVIAVFDPSFGERLQRLRQLAPVWVVDTPVTKETYRRLRVTGLTATTETRGHYQLFGYKSE